MENLNTKCIPSRGVIEVMPKLGDFIAGGETGILETSINASGDWRGFESAGEWQRDMTSLFETDACVSFSFCDAVETYGNFCIRSGRWSAEDVAWLKDHGYCNPDGTLNFSDRFLAKMSNTTEQFGNSLPNVGQAAHDFGLVPESAWPSPWPFKPGTGNTTFNWNTYYAAIPQSVKDLGLAFKARFLTQYEWVIYPGSGATPATIEKMLQVAPIQLATAVCQPWNTSAPINGCGAGTAHATLMTFTDAKTKYTILDHYVPFDKTFAIDYTITYGMRIVVSPIAQPAAPAPFHYTFTKGLVYGNAGNDATELKALQTALQTLKRADGTTYMKVGVFGPFGPQTAAALDLFERDHHITDPAPGHNFGPMNRAAMNAALLAAN